MALAGVAWMVEGMVDMEDAAEDPPPLFLVDERR